jgi:hypothetical protein
MTNQDNLNQAILSIASKKASTDSSQSRHLEKMGTRYSGRGSAHYQYTFPNEQNQLTVPGFVAVDPGTNLISKYLTKLIKPKKKTEINKETDEVDPSINIYNKSRQIVADVEIENYKLDPIGLKPGDPGYDPNFANSVLSLRQKKIIDAAQRSKELETTNESTTENHMNNIIKNKIKNQCYKVLSEMLRPQDANAGGKIPNVKRKEDEKDDNSGQGSGPDGKPDGKVAPSKNPPKGDKNGGFDTGSGGGGGFDTGSGGGGGSGPGGVPGVGLVVSKETGVSPTITPATIPATTPAAIPATRPTITPAVTVSKGPAVSPTITPAATPMSAVDEAPPLAGEALSGGGKPREVFQPVSPYPDVVSDFLANPYASSLIAAGAGYVDTMLSRPGPNGRVNATTGKLRGKLVYVAPLLAAGPTIARGVENWYASRKEGAQGDVIGEVGDILPAAAFDTAAYFAGKSFAGGRKRVIPRETTVETPTKIEIKNLPYAEMIKTGAYELPPKSGNYEIFRSPFKAYPDYSTKKSVLKTAKEFIEKNPIGSAVIGTSTTGVATQIPWKKVAEFMTNTTGAQDETSTQAIERSRAEVEKIRVQPLNYWAKKANEWMQAGRAYSTTPVTPANKQTQTDSSNPTFVRVRQ